MCIGFACIRVTASLKTGQDLKIFIEFNIDFIEE